MKHLITLLQLIQFLIIDIVIFIYYLKWDGNSVSNSHTYRYIKQTNGVVRSTYKWDKHHGFTSKYSAIFNMKCIANCRYHQYCSETWKWIIFN